MEPPGDFDRRATAGSDDWRQHRGPGARHIRSCDGGAVKTDPISPVLPASTSQPGFGVSKNARHNPGPRSAAGGRHRRRLREFSPAGRNAVGVAAQPPRSLHPVADRASSPCTPDVPAEQMGASKSSCQIRPAAVREKPSKDKEARTGAAREDRWHHHHDGAVRGRAPAWPGRRQASRSRERRSRPAAARSWPARSPMTSPPRGPRDDLPKPMDDISSG